MENITPDPASISFDTYMKALPALDDWKALKGSHGVTIEGYVLEREENGRKFEFRRIPRQNSSGENYLEWSVMQTYTGADKRTTKVMKGVLDSQTGEYVVKESTIVLTDLARPEEAIALKMMQKDGKTIYLYSSHNQNVTFDEYGIVLSGQLVAKTLEAYTNEYYTFDIKDKSVAVSAKNNEIVDFHGIARVLEFDDTGMAVIASEDLPKPAKKVIFQKTQTGLTIKLSEEGESGGIKLIGAIIISGQCKMDEIISRLTHPLMSCDDIQDFIPIEIISNF